MTHNPLTELVSFGQSLWIDYLGRDLLSEGNLERLIRDDGISGVTMNPATLQRDISYSTDYAAEIRTFQRQGLSSLEVYQALMISDVQKAADALLGQFESSDGKDGYVSADIDPRISRDYEAMVIQARTLWHILDRPNVLIRIPSNSAGVRALQQLTFEAINTNAGLIFSLDRYRDVTRAYIEGLESRLNSGESLAGICSVASIFVGTLDRLFDPQFDALVKKNANEAGLLLRLQGQIGISTAKMAYNLYKELFGGDRFSALAERGARHQRLLWGRTGHKENVYSDIKYVEALIGVDTIASMPWETLNAYRDHGEPRGQLVQNTQRAGWILDRLMDLGFDLDAMTEKLEQEVMDLFAASFESMLGVLDRRAAILDPDTAALASEIPSGLHVSSRTRSSGVLDPTVSAGLPTADVQAEAAEPVVYEQMRFSNEGNPHEELIRS